MFNAKTYTYLSQARKNEMDPRWFEKNRDAYLEHVKKPMSSLIVKVWEKFDDDLPGIRIDPSRVSKPIRLLKNNPEEKPLVKSESSFYFAISPTSRFEWNPGIYFKIGPGKNDNKLGLGLYHISSRQTRKMRHAVSENFEEFDAIMRDAKLRRRFGGLTGDRYNRIPRGLMESDPALKYLMHKDFHLVRNYSREEILSKTFPAMFVKDIAVALPFFKWVRNAVGIYQRDEEKLFSSQVGLAPYKEGLYGKEESFEEEIR